MTSRQSRRLLRRLPRQSRRRKGRGAAARGDEHRPKQARDEYRGGEGGVKREQSAPLRWGAPQCGHKKPPAFPNKTALSSIGGAHLLPVAACGVWCVLRRTQAHSADWRSSYNSDSCDSSDPSFTPPVYMGEVPPRSCGCGDVPRDDLPADLPLMADYGDCGCTY